MRGAAEKHRLWRIGFFGLGGVSRKVMVAAGVLCAGQAGVFHPPAARGLEPAEIVVVFNTQSANSLLVAQYYMKARKIPLKNLIPVSCDVAENITEAQYRNSFVPQIKKQLAEKQLDSEKPGNTPIKCIVTTYDIPLRVLAYQPTVAERGEIAALVRQQEQMVKVLSGEVGAYEAIAAAEAGATGPASAPATASAPKATWQTILPQLNTAASGAAGRVVRLPAPQRKAAMKDFVTVQERVAGITGILTSITVPSGSPDALMQQAAMDDLRTHLQKVQTEYAQLAKEKDAATARDKMMALRTEAEGEIGRAKEIDDQLKFLQPANSESCLDNELALLFAEPDYPRADRLANPKYLDEYPVLSHMAQQPGAKITRTLLVTRLDGVSVASTEKMIDTTIKTEGKGLDGKVYLDARGLRGTDPYSLFDADIRRTADWLKGHTDLQVALEDTPAFFNAADSPDCALYCGWYSLRQYLDTVQIVPGAVGYHVASYEMESLHNQTETGWVPNMLKHGFCGTLGATDEPYLDSFPKPSEFFPLLLSGQFTQGEVWQMTEPWLSWRVGFVGDPLYNPYKLHPRVKVQDLLEHPVLRYAFADMGREAPATAPAGK